MFEPSEGTLPLPLSLSPSLPLPLRIRKSHDRSCPTVHAGVQLVSVRRARTDETTYQVPAQTEELELPPSVPVPIATSEPANEEAMDQLNVQSTIPPGIHVHVRCVYMYLYHVHVHVPVPCTCTCTWGNSLCIIYVYCSLYEYS